MNSSRRLYVGGVSIIGFACLFVLFLANRPAAQTAADGYVGDDTCLTCHDAQKSVWTTAHGRKADARTPAAQHGCETCHGPGQAHVDDDNKGHIRKFTPADPRAACLLYTSPSPRDGLLSRMPSSA